MTQVSIRLDDELVEEMDALVADGTVASRTDAVRRGLEALIDEHRRALVGSRIAEAYRNKPQTPEEIAGLEASTAAMITAEPW